MRLAGKRIVVTGGAGGAGAASVRLFRAEGAAVVAVDRDRAAGEALAAELAEAGLPTPFVAADVSRPDEAAAAVDAALEALGGIDVLFNHAGIIIVRPFFEHSVADWDELMDNNARSAFLMSRLVLPGMLERGRGTLVFTSTTGVRAATPLESIYCASKAAMHALARGLAVEFRDQGIRTNALCPSFVRTNHGLGEIAQLRAFGVFASEGDVAAMQDRICEPEEIAEVALFLTSDAPSFVNGAEVFVDNTFTAV